MEISVSVPVQKSQYKEGSVDVPSVCGDSESEVVRASIRHHSEKVNAF